LLWTTGWAACLLLTTACGGAETAPEASDTPADAGNAGSRPDSAQGGGAGRSQDASGSGGGAGRSQDAAGEGAVAGDASPGAWLRDRYPGDQNLSADPSVLFHDDFESGWGRWTSPQADTSYLHIEQAGLAHGGQRYLRSTVTRADLAATQYISASPRFSLPRRVDSLFWRLHVRFPTIAPNPHHWIRVAAGTPAFSSSGLANTVPDGNEGFWFDFDASLEDVFNFYVYWYAMRSGRCNDGSTTPGCAGDQGVTYHYGNIFRPTGQSPFVRDAWFCVELAATVNTVGANDGTLTFWIDDALVGSFGPGYPDGTWLRDSFNVGGCSWSACTAPVPFEGFDFRTNADVLFKEIFLDAYYERDSSASKWDALVQKGLTVSDEQTILYDDIVVATERIGCRR
jgi:hypothetical protein